MNQKLATKRKISSQTQNSFFITEQQIQRLIQKVIGELQHRFTKRSWGSCYNAMGQLSGWIISRPRSQVSLFARLVHYVKGYFTKSQGPAVSTEDQSQRGASYVFGKIGSPGRVRSPMNQGFGAVEAGPLFLVLLCVSSPLPVCLQTTILMKINQRVHNLKKIVVDLHHRDFYIFGTSY